MCVHREYYIWIFQWMRAQAIDRWAYFWMYFTFYFVISFLLNCKEITHFPGTERSMKFPKNEHLMFWILPCKPKKNKKQNRRMRRVVLTNQTTPFIVFWEWIALPVTDKKSLVLVFPASTILLLEIEIGALISAPHTLTHIYSSVFGGNIRRIRKRTKKKKFHTLRAFLFAANVKSTRRTEEKIGVG